jgi:proteasome accessory factor PafA2
MAIPKICGIETEYGVLARGVDMSAVAASTVLVNAYSGRDFVSAWDFSAERPFVDAREDRTFGSSFPEIEYQQANTVLTNGARYYVDHAHPEVSSPECRTALEAVKWDLAADEVMRRSMMKSSEMLGVGAEIVVYKNNSDGKGNSYGCHENYLVDRKVPFGHLAAAISVHFVTRQVFCGAGKIGRENGPAVDNDLFQVSQRADFFEEEVGLETTVRRPIVNTRDEPHADATRYRRLHVIVGDANMSEVATLLKIGTTAIVLSMIEDFAFPMDLVLRSPVEAIRRISADPGLTGTVETVDGRRMTALDIQHVLHEHACMWAERHGLESVGVECGTQVLDEWGRVLDDLSRDPTTTRDRVDWVAKQHLIEAYASTRSVPRGDARLKMIDIQYHDLRPGRGLANKAALSRLIHTDDVMSAVVDPPASTRAYFRGRVLARWPEAVVAANWDSLVLDVGADSLVRVPMDDPLRGTHDLVARILDEAATPGDLVRALGIRRDDMTA